ncbi:sterol regulatory element-binding protein cleavage-activating protein [Grosmannia clavigera kw1407]|uniref:Sterol regulatory element-binding protein cleavage-activating protein n=1 Tax=Grosmannia clavigera (strain kw1407 / UAMH 11150) TaxID=655863 RepID=F0X977_GROCL|nr:sterol regulatory element-binding protein cleavage-activating protein [Grosmannia clavigera kw1407]EFX05629.1 sterol regulatory element-binding protein cleavage-activating protein [Grosmannia clavigera kw1407]
MLWYLLYPFRGTTNAPRLAPGHPLRKSLTHYGVYIARNVATTLLLSVAVTIALLYPVPFLYTSDFTSSTSHIPRHVWTNATPLKNGIDVEPHIVMRSIWVHGSYMQALNRDVLLSTLELQDELLGPTKNFNPHRSNALDSLEIGDPLEDLSPEQRDAFHVVNGLTNQSWFFHSPLLYWSDDREAIASDSDILATVNEHQKQATSINVTLRHSLTFSGERFEDRALVAADALVITLVHLRDSPVGRQWERKSAGLASRLDSRWTVYPKEVGHSLQSQLYEFQFLPMSLQDSLMLALAYTITFVYVIQNLSKLPAIKSRPGLILTVVAQIFMSIMSSFTVCAILSVDLSRIPRAAYPIVIVSMSLENILRLIKAVILTNSESSTSSRVGEAYGKTAHIALASVVEHLVLLWIISKLVASGLSGFCGFLAIAIVFDFIYLSTFFLSVLSIEVRRTELGEAIEKTASMRRRLHSTSSQPPSPTALGLPRPSWFAAFLQGRVDVSTRIAGTVILVCFVVIAQWHFFDFESMVRAVVRLFRVAAPDTGGGHNTNYWDSVSPQFKEVHQARSPASWLRLQDQTAREMNNAIRPYAYSCVARVYEPLVFVLNGADRMPSVSERPFLPAVYDFVRHQWKSFLVAILAVPAAVRTFVSYLLWIEADEADDHVESADEPRLSVKSLDQGHALDVALLVASPDGLVVSVGLDRRIRVWNVQFGCRNYLLTEEDDSTDVPFPVLALAIDDDSTWLAILSTYMVMLWNLETKRWGATLPVDLCGQKPEAFFFTPALKCTKVPSLVVVRRNGTFAELWADSCEMVDHPICQTPLVCAAPLHCRAPTIPPVSVEDHFAIIAASRNGCVYRMFRAGDEWISEGPKQQANRERSVHSVVALAQFPAYLVVRTWSVDLVDLRTSNIIHTFRTTTAIKARSLRYLCSKRRQLQIGPPELSHFSLVYSSARTGHCLIQTYLPEQEGGSIALFSNDGLTGIPASSDSSCCTWDRSRQVTRDIPNPGKWEALPNGCIVGVRRQGQAIPDGCTGSLSHTASGHESAGRTDGSLRRRGLGALAGTVPATPTTAASTTKTSTAATVPASGPDCWEAWSMWSMLDNRDGDSAGSRGYVTQPLGGDHDDLLVTEPGPIVQVGAGTVALGIGTSIKIITLGHERFGSAADLLRAEPEVMRAGNASGRRRKNRPLPKGA